MKLAVIGSRSITSVDLKKYLPSRVTEIVSGGAKGVDTLAAEYAKENGLLLTEFLPDYTRYKKAAPLKRNEQIARYADAVLAFWDKRSKGTLHTISFFEREGKPVSLIILEKGK